MNKAYIIIYDITNNKLRSKIEKLLKNYGIRLQYSVFCCRQSKDELAQARNCLQEILQRFRTLCEPNDSIIILENVSENRLNFVLGKADIFKDYKVF